MRQKEWLKANWAMLATRVAISGIALVGICLHLKQLVTFDAPILGLIALGVLPWLSTVIKSLQLPGGFKIELREARERAERALSMAADAKGAADECNTPHHNWPH